MTTGQRIKEARKKAGLTQKQLAEKLGIAYQTLAQWENDLRNPKYETIERIANALNVYIPKLLDDNDRKIYISGEFYGGFDEYVKNCESGYKFTDGEITIVRLYNSLNANGQQKVADYAEDLTKIPDYRAETAPQSSPPPPEGTDTTPPPNAPEGSQEGGENR